MHVIVSRIRLSLTSTKLKSKKLCTTNQNSNKTQKQMRKYEPKKNVTPHVLPGNLVREERNEAFPKEKESGLNIVAYCFFIYVFI
jgi:hypothetical protein